MRRTIRIGIGVLASVLVAIVVVSLAGAWYISDILNEDGLLANHEEPEFDLVVSDVGDGLIALDTTADTDENGRWRLKGVFGLKSPGAYNQVGAIVELDESHVVREFLPLDGGLEVGQKVRIDNYSFPDDPFSAHGIPFEDVTFSSSIGSFPAWLIPGTSDTWVILVHGRRAKRREALRILPSIVEHGHPSLVITYRNDEDLPRSDDGRYQFGQSEWEELEGAARYAIANGADDIILVGFSMGGAIVTNFLLVSPLSEEVRGVILDSPMVNFNDTVDLGGRERGLPRLLVVLAKTFAAIRFDVDWDALDYVSRADEFDLPILLFHGDEDRTVPIESSEAFAEARPDIVQYVPFEGSSHVGGWNRDREKYESAVSSFLSQLVE